jgi:hypothetical protein
LNEEGSLGIREDRHLRCAAERLVEAGLQRADSLEAARGLRLALEPSANAYRPNSMGVRPCVAVEGPIDCAR